MRVNELARELGMTSKDLLAKIPELLGITVPNHASSLTVDQARLIRERLAEEAEEAAEAAAEAAAETAPAGAAPAAAEPPAATEPPAPAPEAPATETPPAPPPSEPEKPTGPATLFLKEKVVLKDFAGMLGLKPNLLIAELMRMNIFATINDPLDFKIARQLGEKHGFKVDHERKPVEPKAPAPAKKKEAPKPEAAERPDELQSRPPVVTFMGHVDHGKTSLLDYIRKTKVVAGEAGGITQHIGAYMVTFRDKQITFIDTPGHAAFTAMRARGANVTDIAVIVISAEEGIKPQTKEAIQHARAANVAILCAINKIDLPGANLDRVYGQLQQEGLTPEPWGGQVICCPVSAVTGQGMDELLEMILLQADMLELKAAPRRKAHGYVLEARLEPGMGPVATLLVKSGTLQVGDAVVCGLSWGRVKALINDRGVKIRTAAPSHAAQLLGLTSVPDAGAEFQVLANDREARALAEERQAAKRMETLQAPRRGFSLDDLLNQTDGQAAVVRELPVVIKADVQGSLEALQQSLGEIKSDKVTIKVVLAGVGNITVNDVLLAKASQGLIVGFHVTPENGVPAAARREGVEIRLYSIIYELVDEVRNAMAGLLEPITRESVTGQLLVKQVFQLSKKGAVAGCVVRSGRISSRARARVRRQGEVLYEGAIASLKRFQNDAAEVREGQECGVRLDDYGGFQPGDMIEAYEVSKIQQSL